MSEFVEGQRVVIKDAYGHYHQAIATSGVETRGHSFPIVWVVLADGREPLPWPVEDVSPREGTAAS